MKLKSQISIKSADIPNQISWIRALMACTYRGAARNRSVAPRTPPRPAVIRSVRGRIGPRPLRMPRLMGSERWM